MADRGIEVVRAHLAKLPPADSLTIAERRAQYERAEKVFPVSPDVKVERVTAGAAPAEWLRPPSARAGPCRALPPRRRLRDRVAALPSPPRGRHRGRGEHQRAPARLPPGARASLPGGPRRRRGRLSLASRPGHRRRAHRGRGRLGGRRPHGGDAARASGCPAAPAGGRRVHLAVGRSHLQRQGAIESKAAVDPIVRQAGVAEMARAYLGATDPRSPLASPLFADLRGLPRS